MLRTVGRFEGSGEIDFNADGHRRVGDLVIATDGVELELA